MTLSLFWSNPPAKKTKSCLRIIHGKAPESKATYAVKKYAQCSAAVSLIEQVENEAAKTPS